MTDIYLRPSLLSPRLDAMEPDARCPLPRPGHWAERVTIYMGTPGTGAFLHQDIFGTQSWMAQIRGEKHWRLATPGARAPGTKDGLDLFDSPDLPFPVYDVTLTPGDVLYVPPHWWHQIRNEKSNLAVAGHFSSVEVARAGLAQAENSPDPQTRAEWPPLWRQILELDDAGDHRG